MYQNGDGAPPPPAGDKFNTQKRFRERYLGRRIMSMGATGLTPGQKNFSIFEIELLAMCWALEHLKYYCLNADRIVVKTNNSPKRSL